MTRHWLKTIREKAGSTQAEVAAAAEIERAYYAMLEAGTRRPSYEVALKISKVLGFDWTLFYETPEIIEKEG